MNLERFKNPGTIIAIVSLVGLIALQFGVQIDMEWLDTTVKLFCALGIVLGVLNNPDTPNIDNPFLPKK